MSNVCEAIASPPSSSSSSASTASSDSSVDHVKDIDVVQVFQGQIPNASFRMVIVATIVAVFAAFLLIVSSEVIVMQLLSVPMLIEINKLSFLTMLLAVPLTQAVIVLVSKSSSNQTYRAVLREKYKTNVTFRAYQIVGWIFYCISIGLIAYCFQFNQEKCSTDNGDIICTSFLLSVAMNTLIAQVFIVSSLLALEGHKEDGPVYLFGDKSVLMVHNYMNMLLVVSALFLALGAEYGHAQDSYFALKSGIGSLMLCIAAVVSTYGLGGILAHTKGWTFYQPFTGGATFIFFQIVSWTCFSFSVLLQALYIISIFIVEFELFVGVMGFAGTLCIVSEILMVISVFVFSSKDYSSAPEHSFRYKLHSFASSNFQLLTAILIANLPLLPTLLFFLPFFCVSNLTWMTSSWYGVSYIIIQTVVVVAIGAFIQVYHRDAIFYSTKKSIQISPYNPKYWAIPLLAVSIPFDIVIYHFYYQLDALYATIVIAIFWYAYNFITFPGQPESTGCRMNNNLINSYNPMIEALQSYFSGKVIKTCDLDPKEIYIMGFHPHGVLPMTVLWLQLTTQWRALFPNVYACPLTASIVHQLPIVRDILQCYGGREVTKKAFTFALSDKKSVILVPGGQAEMLESRSNVNQLRIHKGHKGFIRIAIETGKPLVPIVSFQEGEILDNINAPLIQRWFVKKFAFPFPHFPYGRLGLPIPRRVPMTVVVGKPISVKMVENPNKEVVDAVHELYFKQIAELFHANKKQAGCEHFDLVFV